MAEAVAVETHGKGIDGEVAPVLVIFERTVFDHRLARVVAVTFLAGSHKFHFQPFIFHLRRPEIAEHRNVGLAPQLLLQGIGHLYAAAHHHHVDVAGRAFEEQIAHVAAHHIALRM